jgi:RNA polymerase sigma-70 factor (ECF subfamily)
VSQTKYKVVVNRILLRGVYQVEGLKEDAVRAAVKLMKPLPEPPDELESLFRDQHTRIFRTAYRITGNAVDAEDVLQNVFLRLVRGGELYDLKQNPEAYLQRAAVNASLDILRSRTRAKSVALQDLETEPEGNAACNPENQQVDRELRKLIESAVAKLGDRSAEMFALRYYEGYDNREIAEKLGTSQMVVGVMLHRARGKMRREIGEYLEKHHEA